jgi:hypothetical protein
MIEVDASPRMIEAHWGNAIRCRSIALELPDEFLQTRDPLP